MTALKGDWKQGLSPNQIKRVKNVLNFGVEIKSVNKFKEPESKIEYMRVYYTHNGEDKSTLLTANLRPAYWPSYEA